MGLYTRLPTRITTAGTTVGTRCQGYGQGESTGRGEGRVLDPTGKCLWSVVLWLAGLGFRVESDFIYVEFVSLVTVRDDGYYPESTRKRGTLHTRTPLTFVEFQGPSVTTVGGTQHKGSYAKRFLVRTPL